MVGLEEAMRCGREPTSPTEVHSRPLKTRGKWGEVKARTTQTTKGKIRGGIGGILGERMQTGRASTADGKSLHDGRHQGAVAPRRFSAKEIKYVLREDGPKLRPSYSKGLS